MSESQEKNINQPVFFYIPLSRLIIMSIITFGLYDFYWMYRQYKYAIEKDESLDSSRTLVAMFTFGFYDVLSIAISQNKELNDIELPTFDAPVIISRLWFILRLISFYLLYISINYSYTVTGIISLCIPAYLCLTPLQSYINSVNKKKNPDSNYHSWSTGEVLCSFGGLFIWILLLLASYKNYNQIRWESDIEIVNELYEKGKYNEAEYIAKNTLNFAEKSYGMDYENILSSLLVLRNIYESAEKYNELEEVDKRIISITEPRPEYDRNDIARIKNEIANIYIRQKKPMRQRKFA